MELTKLVKTNMYNDQIKVELQDSMGTDRSISDAAWTSSLDYQKKKNRTEEDVRRVINMLADNRHSTPFESVIFRFWIKMPIQTDRQHMTHRLQSASGMSGRYRTMPNEWLKEPEDVLDIVQKISGASLGFIDQYDSVCENANDLYQYMIQYLKEDVKNNLITNDEFKRLREFYRGMLPQNNMTERVSIFNLRSFANYQKLRNTTHAQPEIRYVAELMLKEVIDKNVCPIAIEALIRNGWNI